ncbi:MAG: hypothetical protein KBE65_22960 [Phycisphaerae bacterium]|nr:hypothetical protein [Phycisphaerae bacterium]
MPRMLATSQPAATADAAYLIVGERNRIDLYTAQGDPASRPTILDNLLTRDRTQDPID